MLRNCRALKYSLSALQRLAGGVLDTHAPECPAPISLQGSPAVVPAERRGLRDGTGRLPRPQGPQQQAQHQWRGQDPAHPGSRQPQLHHVGMGRATGRWGSGEGRGAPACCEPRLTRASTPIPKTGADGPSSIRVRPCTLVPKAALHPVSLSCHPLSREGGFWTRVLPFTRTHGALSACSLLPSPSLLFCLSVSISSCLSLETHTHTFYEPIQGHFLHTFF